MSLRKFIQNDFVRKTISKLAQEETGKRQYYRPVYSLHKWWARRAGAQFRAIILLAVNNNERLLIPTKDGDLSDQSDYFGDHNLENTIILDPFMGGGTTLIEANRVGAKTIGCDINPVAYWIVRETLKPLELAKLKAYFDELNKTVGERIRLLYRTRCSQCKLVAGEGLYYFWIRLIQCPNCGQTVPLYKRTMLNAGASRNKGLSRANPATVFCPNCFALNSWSGKGSCMCQSCKSEFQPDIGTFDKGRFTCPTCKKEKISLIKTLKGGQTFKEKLIAIEYLCSYCKKRLYKSPDENDLKKLDDIWKAFEQEKNDLIFPRNPILKGASSVRWQQHNFHYYYELFNPRQLVAFDYLIRAINKIKEEEYRFAFFTIFSNSLEYNNMMTPYNYKHRKLHHLFTYHALPFTTTPVENAVWGSSNGAGTFVNCYTRYYNAKKYCAKPFDKFKNSSGQIRTVESKSETIAATFVTNFQELMNIHKASLLLNQDSSSLPNIPDKSIDFVITDPPYFDNIHYSELSNFFYVWLSKVVGGNLIPQLEHVPTEREAIVNAGMKGKDKEGYQVLVASVFKECKRVLKDEGKLIFTFHHTKADAWWTILSAVAESGFQVDDYFPVVSEYRVNPHIREKNGLDMDLILFCGKKTNSFGSPSPTLDLVTRQATDSALAKSNTKNTNEFFLCFMGELLKSLSAIWPNKELNLEWFTQTFSHFDKIFRAEIANKPQLSRKIESNGHLPTFS